MGGPLSAEVVKALDEERVAYVIFRVASDGDVRRAAYAYLTASGKARKGDGLGRGANFVESMLAPPGGANWYGRRVPEGAWVGAIKVHDPAVWERITRHGRLEINLNLSDAQVVSKRREGDVPMDAHVLARIITAVLRPVTDELTAVMKRLERVEAESRRDVFGEIVRAKEPPREFEEARRLKRLQGDRFGETVRAREAPPEIAETARGGMDEVSWAIVERRPPLVQTAFDRLRRRRGR